MADPNTNPFAAMLPSFFFGGDKNDPRVNPQLRQRIALALMARDRKFPKNVGEGLSSIGDAIGDRGLMRQMLDADVAQQDVVPPPAAGAAAPAAAPPPGYAPASPLASAPPVRAIDAAAGPPGVIPPPAAPPAGPLTTAPSDLTSTPTARQPQGTLFNPAPMLNPSTPIQTPPATGFNRVPTAPLGQGASAADGGYNSIDAQAGFKRPTPGYIGDAIARNVSDPDRQAYLGSLVGGEAPRGPADVSPTGADGPFQFTRGTARQYGLMGPQGDQRRDLDASVLAANRLTDDNAATFERINGRPPSPADLAVLHQQGGTTGSRMIAGTGNAPAGNLAVNNISPDASPAAAVAKIKSYYGMPDQVATSRDQITSALLGRQGGDSAAAPPPQPPMAFSGIQAAPPNPAEAIRPAPQRLAQAQPDAIPGYVPPEGKDPTGAPIIGMKPREVELRNWLAQNQNNPYAAMKVAPELNALEQERTIRQNEANEKFKADLARTTKQAEQREQARITQAERAANAAHTQAQTRKEAIVENPEEKYVMGPDNVVRPIKVEGEDPNAAPGGKLSENEQKTLIYHGWAKLGNQAITGNDKLLAHGLSQEALGKVPVFGNQLQDENYRRAKNGADNFILSFMRSTSGAAYGATERLDHAKAMLPKIGDDDKTLADKAAQRQQFIDTEYAGLGKQAQKKADYIAKNYDPDSAAGEQRRIDIEMQGLKGGQVGEVKTNKNPKSPDFGKQRLWNGSRWVEVK